MNKTVVVDVAGLSPSLLGTATPNLCAFRESGKMASIRTILPAVTCSVQSTFVTGRYPNEHGIVGNGWYFRDECQVKFWQQSNALIQSPKLWDKARSIDPTFKCANLFWWYNMYSSVDYSVTPRPMYPADGRKIPDIYTKPAQLRVKLQKELGQFPLFSFWGPGTSISSTKWIAEAAKLVDRLYNPTLTLIYLPHLDYCLQRVGPMHEQTIRDLRELDAICGDLIDLYRPRGAQIVFISEYGITRVSKPVHLNRELRNQGMIAVREELGRELLDAGASSAFAVADHQVAHIYVNERTRIPEVRSLLEDTNGVAEVLDDDGKRSVYLDHPRAGDLVAVADPDAWFTYYYWLEDSTAPDYARTVDIHRKPGYDPVELFIDPNLRVPQLKVGWMLLKKRLGFRYLMDIVPLDASLVRGSHGRADTTAAQGPLFMTQASHLLHNSEIEATDVQDLILQHLTNKDHPIIRNAV